MSAAAPRAVALGLAGLAFVVAFAAPAITPLPVAWYAPGDGAWTFEVRPSGVAIDLYGRLALALLAGGATLALAWPLAHRARALGDRAVGLVAAWLVTVFVLAALFFAWTLHYRVPVP